MAFLCKYHSDFNILRKSGSRTATAAAGMQVTIWLLSETKNEIFLVNSLNHCYINMPFLNLFSFCPSLFPHTVTISISLFYFFIPENHAFQYFSLDLSIIHRKCTAGRNIHTCIAYYKAAPFFSEEQKRKITTFSLYSYFCVHTLLLLLSSPSLLSLLLLLPYYLVFFSLPSACAEADRNKKYGKGSYLHAIISMSLYRKRKTCENATQLEKDFFLLYSPYHLCHIAVFVPCYFGNVLIKNFFLPLSRWQSQSFILSPLHFFVLQNEKRREGVLPPPQSNEWNI